MTASPDIAAECAGQRPHPDLVIPEPDRPCSATDRERTTQYRYDASGLLVSSNTVFQTPYFSATYRYALEDSGTQRTESNVYNGAVENRTVTDLDAGRPARAALYEAQDGTLELQGYRLWTYGAAQDQKASTDAKGRIWAIERTFRDAKGRVFGSDRGDFADAGRLAQYRWERNSWYANGNPAAQIIDLGDPQGMGHSERHWDACGNLTYDGGLSLNGRWSRWSDWTWDANGLPQSRHDRWNTELPGWSSTETFTLDESGRVVSSVIVTTSRPAGLADQTPVPDQHATYLYDTAGRLIERTVDGVSDFHVRYDDQGRVSEAGEMRYSYEGCTR